MNCLYSGDKPLGIVQSNAEDVEYSSGVSVKDKIDENTSAINTVSSRVTVITPKVYGGNIDSEAKMNSLERNTTYVCYLLYTGAPFNACWATIRTFGNNTVINQEVVCLSGIAFRHWESNAWSVWKKITFS